MKKLALLFAVCIASLGFQALATDDLTDSARAAKRNSAAIATAVSTRQKSDAVSVTATRPTTPVQKLTEQNVRDRSGTSRDGVVATSGQSRVATPLSVTTRTATVQPRTVTSGQKTSDRVTRNDSVSSARVTNNPNVSRAATNARTGTAGANISTVRRSGGTNVSRAAVAGGTNSLAGTKDYKKCREIYYSCMDEFCANKDTQLKRCACSTKVHSFDGIKKQMSKVEDKMLTFSERLLTVNMDKEDAAAISVATEGELAYQKDDKSASKNILDEISKKLKSSTDDTNLERNLSAISLSLNYDSAFDNIDSMLGASTSTKEGTALYNAAIPICEEMAAEICEEEELNIAKSGYLMAIEQDCNTVAKAYETKQEQALEKLREGSALLDISRLDIHQKRNSDDILTCKKKMLDMMYDPSVCGTDLGKCLDTTGKYIDPSTGQAFLTDYLVNLENLLTRPTDDQKWTTVPGNSAFVIYLNSKKTYLEPAMENCQDISDRVWNDFIEDALAQIKLAQERKLEDMRQSCTSLTTQCLTDTAKSISEFDARALSIFGVSADKTVNEMCAGIKTACTALLESYTGDSNWVGGMTEIATDKTYETIIQTCREVGKACIIQTCKSISGNFGLCENIERSVNRKSVINRSSCWSDVLECVASAGADSIDLIMTKFAKTPGLTSGDFYIENYGDSPAPFRTNNDGASCNASDILDDNGVVIQSAKNCVFDICQQYGCGTGGKLDCATCRLAEKIWGNCEFVPSTELEDLELQNMIKIPKDSDAETLLSWFAKNTGTEKRKDSCMDTTCPAGNVAMLNSNDLVECIRTDNLSSDRAICSTENKFKIVGNWTNCCQDANNNPLNKDAYGNCCAVGGIGLPGYSPGGSGYHFSAYNNTTNICTNGNTTNEFVAVFNGGSNNHYSTTGTNVLVCVGGTITYSDAESDFPGGKTVNCSGDYVVIREENGIYISPQFDTGTQTPTFPVNRYNILKDQLHCVLNGDQWGTMASGSWTNNSDCNKISGVPNNNDHNLFIGY